MRLDGLHHITMITGDAQRNVDFYADLLGLRLVKTTVNFDAPEAYHLYFGDESGSPGSILTWFEFAGAARGRPGTGMIHTIQLGVTAPAAIEFWAARLSGAGVSCERGDSTLRFTDDDGLAFELVVAATGNPPLVAAHPEIPAEHALIGPQGARAYGRAPAGAGAAAHRTLGFEAQGEGAYQVTGEHRRFAWAYDEPPAEPGRQGAGTVHHIAWACPDAGAAGLAGAPARGPRDGHRRPRPRLLHVDLLPRAARDPVRDRDPLPGFAVDEDPDHLGEALKLPRMHEHLRPQLERTLTPLVNPRARRRAVQA